MPQSAIDRLPAGKRNAAMERLSANALRLRGRKTAAAPFGREDSLEQLVVRLGVIPAFLWPTATAGTGNVHAMPPPQGGQVTLSVSDASTPGAHLFSKGTPSVAHVFTAAGRNTVDASFAGNANAKGRAAATV